MYQKIVLKNTKKLENGFYMGRAFMDEWRLKGIDIQWCEPDDWEYPYSLNMDTKNMELFTETMNPVIDDLINKLGGEFEILVYPMVIEKSPRQIEERNEYQNCWNTFYQDDNF